MIYSSIQERIAMSSLQGLPPLPRSLSGFNLSSGHGESCEPPPPPTRSSSKSQRGGKTSAQSSSRPSPPARQLTTLDTQLAVLRREMVLVQESHMKRPKSFFLLHEYDWKHAVRFIVQCSCSLYRIKSSYYKLLSHNLGFVSLIKK